MFSYLCISWGMGAEGDPFRNPGGGGRSGAPLGEINPSMGYNSLTGSQGVRRNNSLNGELLC